MHYSHYIHTTHTTHYSHYSLHTLLTSLTTHTTHYSLHTPLTTHTTHYSLLALQTKHTLLTPLTTHTTHYSLHTLLTLLTTHTTHTTLPPSVDPEDRTFWSRHQCFSGHVLHYTDLSSFYLLNKKDKTKLNDLEDNISSRDKLTSCTGLVHAGRLSCNARSRLRCQNFAEIGLATANRFPNVFRKLLFI